MIALTEEKPKNQQIVEIQNTFLNQMNQRRSQKRNWQMLIAEAKQNYSILKLKEFSKAGKGLAMEGSSNMYSH